MAFLNTFHHVHIATEWDIRKHTLREFVTFRSSEMVRSKTNARLYDRGFLSSLLENKSVDGEQKYFARSVKHTSVYGHWDTVIICSAEHATIYGYWDSDDIDRRLDVGSAISRHFLQPQGVRKGLA